MKKEKISDFSVLETFPSNYIYTQVVYKIHESKYCDKKVLTKLSEIVIYTFLF